jgi:hypothetical protein
MRYADALQSIMAMQGRICPLTVHAKCRLGGFVQILAETCATHFEVPPTGRPVAPSHVRRIASDDIVTASSPNA